MAAALAVSSRDSQEHEQSYQHASRGGRAGTASSEYAPGAIELARRVVAVLGGRYSAGLGIDVDAGEAQVERWFVAATLFGARIPARVAERTFGVLAARGRGAGSPPTLSRWSLGQADVPPGCPRRA